MAVLTIAGVYPKNLAGVPSIGGSIPSGVYNYVVAAVSTSEGMACPQVTVDVEVYNSKVTLSWTAVPGCTYKVYRKTIAQSWTDSNNHYLGSTSSNTYVDTAASPSAGKPRYFANDNILEMPEDLTAALNVLTIPRTDYGAVQHLASEPSVISLTIMLKGYSTNVLVDKTTLEDLCTVGLPVTVVITFASETWINASYIIKEVTFSPVAGLTGREVWLRTVISLVRAT